MTYLSSRPRAHSSVPSRPGIALATLLGVAGVLATGCGSGGSGGSSPTTPTVEAASSQNGRGDTSTADPSSGALAGAWSSCTGASLRNTYVFSGSRFDQYLDYFDNSDCQGAPIREDGLLTSDTVYASGTYELLDEITTEEGLPARQINMTTDTFLGESIFPSIRVTMHDIVHTGVSGQLIFGAYAGDSPDERPTALDFESPYRRR